MKWFATAAALVAITFGLSFSSQFTSPVISIAGTLSLIFLYASIGIAVLKYRLYEIDVVIGKTVVFRGAGGLHHGGVHRARGGDRDGRR